MSCCLSPVCSSYCLILFIFFALDIPFSSFSESMIDALHCTLSPPVAFHQAAIEFLMTLFLCSCLLLWHSLAPCILYRAFLLMFLFSLGLAVGIILPINILLHLPRARSRSFGLFFLGFALLFISLFYFAPPPHTPLSLSIYLSHTLSLISKLPPALGLCRTPQKKVQKLL